MQMCQEKAENILKCKGFIKELQRMYNAKKVIPVIVGASGTISKASENTRTTPTKKRDQRTTENSHTGHFIHTTSRTHVKVQNLYQVCHRLEIQVTESYMP
jgi:hypothetical protein